MAVISVPGIVDVKTHSADWYYWPFAMFDSPLALDVSAAVGLGVPRARLLRHGALLRRVSASEYHRRTMEHHPVRAIGIPVDRVSGFLDQPGDCRRLRG